MTMTMIMSYDHGNDHGDDDDDHDDDDDDNDHDNDHFDDVNNRSPALARRHPVPCSLPFSLQRHNKSHIFHPTK